MSRGAAGSSTRFAGGSPSGAAGRADLVRALDQGGEAGLAAMAELLGYEARSRPGRGLSEDERSPPVAPESSTDFSVDSRETPEVGPTRFAPTSFWRPVAVELSSREELPGLVEPPAEDREQPEYSEESFYPREGIERRSATPIVAWPRLWRALDDRLRTSIPRSEIDVGKLVERWARGESLERLPRLAGLAHSRVVVILDQSPPLLPFQLDQLDLAARLLRRLGAASARLVALTGTDVAAVAVNKDERVLALTDLGGYGNGRRMAYWKRLGQSLRRSNVSALALVPSPPRKWPRWAASLWSALEWSAPGKVFSSTVTEDAALEGRPDPVEALLCLASPAVRIETGLLRELRWLVPGADLETECRAWSHRDVVSRSALGLRLGKDQARRRLASFFAQPEDIQRAAIASLRAWHEGLAPEIWAEEVVGLLANGVPESWLGADTVRQSVELVGKICGLVELGGSEGGHLGASAEAYFGRLKGRASRPMWSHPRLRRPLARAMAALRQRNSETEPPAGATPEMFIPSTDDVERWAVWHEGADFRFRREGEVGEGSPLATLGARNPVLLVGDGVAQDRELELDGEPPSFPVPRGGRPIDVVSDVEALRLELWQPPEWAVESGRDVYGLWASFEVAGVTQVMRWIPPGRFQMGSPESEAGRFDDEGPRHWVVLTEGFWMAETPCTQELWEAVMGAGENPSDFENEPQRPVEQVSWDDCQTFVDRLNFTIRGLEVRLPTEAEWEYACRAGTETAYWSGSDDTALGRVGWYDENSSDRTHTVAKKLPSPWGLYDMHGNVYEWCWDWQGSYKPDIAVDPEGPPEGAKRVFRGGSWNVSARDVRAAFRGGFHPVVRARYLGFRLSRGRGPGGKEAERKARGSARAGRGTSPRRRSRRDLAWVERLGWAIDGGSDRFGRWASFEVEGVVQRMRWIVPGRFWMGSPEGEAGRFEWEGPRHEVTLTQGFWLGETPCTQALWQAVMGRNPSYFKSPRRPVEQVTWEDCQRFFERLDVWLPELGAGLPTEAQWEYACRAGTTAATWLGDLEILGERNAPRLDGIAWYGGNSGVGYDLEKASDSSDWKETQYPHSRAGAREVASKAPNPWGLYDMLGNVLEWCSDSWDWGDLYPGGPRTDPTGSKEGAERVYRGGSWSGVAGGVRAAYRYGYPPDGRYHFLGFRLSRGQEPPPRAEPEKAEPESKIKQAWQKLRGRPPRDEA